MRSIRRFITLAVALISGVCQVAAAVTLAGAYDLLAKSCVGAAPVALGLTLTSPQVLQGLIQSFVKRFPFFPKLGLDLRASPLKLNQQYIAQIASLPTASTYDANNGGYGYGANSARGLLTDVPVTVSNQPTCPLLWNHLDQIKDIKNEYDECIANTAYVLLKGLVDTLLASVNTRNFSYELVIAVADMDYDGLQSITSQANSQGMGSGRILLVNSDVANVLAVDPRMISKDYAGQLLTSDGLRMWTNVGGFALIQEYTDFPTNNATALTAVTAEADDDLFTKANHGLETGDPVVISALTGGTGVLANTRYWAIKASSSTFKLASSYANAVAGTGIDITLDGSAITLRLAENLIAFAFDKRAFAVLAGIPEGMVTDYADTLGIPKTVIFDVLKDPESGMSMAAAKWQAAGTANFYWCPTFVWGASMGKQAASAAQGALTDKAGLRISKGV